MTINNLQRVLVHSGDDQFSVDPVVLADVEVSFAIGEHAFLLPCQAVERLAPEPEVTLEYHGNPSITTTLLRFGQFLAGNRFAKGKAARLSRAWAGRHEEALKVPFLRSVVVILGAL